MRVCVCLLEVSVRVLLGVHLCSLCLIREKKLGHNVCKGGCSNYGQRCSPNALPYCTLNFHQPDIPAILQNAPSLVASCNMQISLNVVNTAPLGVCLRINAFCCTLTETCKWLEWQKNVSCYNKKKSVNKQSHLNEEHTVVGKYKYINMSVCEPANSSSNPGQHEAR